MHYTFDEYEDAGDRLRIEVEVLFKGCQGQEGAVAPYMGGNPVVSRTLKIPIPDL